MAAPDFAIDKLEGNESSRRSRVRADELVGWLRGYAETRINSQLMDQRRCFSPHVVLDFGNKGLMGLQVPGSFGGLDLTTTDFLRVLEQLSAIDLALALFVGNHNVLGLRPILNWARADLQERHLPLLAAGRELGAFALTEPGAGSNPRGLSSRGEPDGAGGWLLTGHKIWSGNAAWANLISVFVRMPRTQAAPGGITGFLVRQGMPGLSMGHEALTMGMRGMVQNAVYMEDVAVGTDELLGSLGQGLTVAHDCMLHGRLAVAASSLGAMKRCAQLMQRYASRRRIDTGRLIDNPHARGKLVEILLDIEALNALIYRVAGLLDAGTSIPAEIFAVCKTTGPELLGYASDALIQMLGGRGYMEPNEATRIARDGRILRIFEGPTETLNMFIGASVINQGARLKSFISECLQAPVLAEEIETSAKAIEERWRGINSIVRSSEPALFWSSALIGEVWSWGILAAATQSEITRKTDVAALGPAVAERALTRFREAYRLALSDERVRPASQSTDFIASCLERHETAIGNVEQQMAGEELGADAMLHRALLPC